MLISKGTTRTAQVYSQAGQLIYEAPADSVADRIFADGFQPGGNGSKRYIYFGNHLIAEDGSAGLRYLHTDALGSPVARTNAAGTITERSYHFPYGRTVSPPQPGPGFTGHVTDTETGLSYMQARYYDPWAGRFLATDPVAADAGSFNRYWYADNSPYANIDPDGRQACSVGEQCIEAPSTKSAPLQPPVSEERRAMDRQVVEAAKTGWLSDGTRVDMTIDEQSFSVSARGTSKGNNITKTCMLCGGNPTTVMRYEISAGASAGHTHGELIEQTVGPHDDPPEPGTTRYVMTKKNVMATENTSVGKRVRILWGPMPIGKDRRAIEKRIEEWNRKKPGGAQIHCSVGC